MHPAFSILFFTTLAGAAQGLVFTLALAALFGLALAPGFLTLALGVAEVLLVAGLAASFMGPAWLVLQICGASGTGVWA